MHWLAPATTLFQCGVIVFLAWLNGRWEKRADDALALAQRLRFERDALAHFLNLQGWQVDYSETVPRVWWPEEDPEEERLAR